MPRVCTASSGALKYNTRGCASRCRRRRRIDGEVAPVGGDPNEKIPWCVYTYYTDIHACMCINLCENCAKKFVFMTLCEERGFSEPTSLSPPRSVCLMSRTLLRCCLTHFA